MDEKEIVVNLYKNVFGTDKGKEIKELFVTEVAKVKSSIDALRLYKKYEAYIIFGRALGTIKNISNDFKKIIKSSGSKHEDVLLEAFSLPQGYYYAVNQNSIKVIDERKESDNIIVDVKNYEKILNDLFEKGMDANLNFWVKGLGSRQTKEKIRAYYLSAFLALSTGRRLTEILKTAEFTKYKNELRVKGILKKGEDDLEVTHKLIPLFDVEKIVTAYRELRKIFDCISLSNREVNNKFNAIFNNFLQENILQNQTFHDLRATYAEVAFLKFGNEEVGKRDFIESALLQESKVRAVDFYLNRVTVK